MSKKPILTDAKVKTFPHIEEKTGKKITVDPRKIFKGIKLSESEKKKVTVDEIRIINLNEEYIRKVLLSRGIAEEYILDKDAEKKELEQKLKEIEDKYKITQSTDFIKNKKIEACKEYKGNLKTKIDISELLYIINKGYSMKTALINILRDRTKYVKDVISALQKSFDKETDNKRREKIKKLIVELKTNQIKGVIDGTNKKNIEDAQNALQRTLERETNKKKIRKNRDYYMYFWYVPM